MMHLKRYTIATLIWIALVGWFVYAFVTTEVQRIDFFGTMLPALPIALWVVVPMLVLYLASVVHMWFYSFVGNFQNRKYEKDYEKLIDAIVDAYLGKANRHYEFKTDRYKLLGTLLENTELKPLNDIAGHIGQDKIDNILDTIKKIEAGEVVEMKQFGLRSENPLVIANNRNRYKKGDISAERVLNAPDKYSKVLAKEVFEEYVLTAPLPNVERYKEFMTPKALNRLFARINADEHRLELSTQKLVEFINMLELNEEDFITISKTLSSSDMLPEQRMELFEMLSTQNDKATAAYLYTLYDLEMVSKAAEILDILPKDEHKNFRAYRALRECGHNFNIDMFV